ncbi:MAG: hypothetical protein NW207_03670 [Cytophagales bacterium]|nr:hypothetical protein [Cytophagales bacterium]
MKIRLNNILYFTLIMCMISACKGFWGDKTDLSFIEIPTATTKPVSYVPIQPVITGFTKPVDIVPGFDELIYVVDAGANLLISYNEAFETSSKETFSIQGITDVAQNRVFDILALGTTDTVIGGKTLRMATLYILELKKDKSTYGLKHASIKQKIIHPFYFTTSLKQTDTLVRFTGVAILADNSYYISRTGVSNVSSQFGGPDDAVIYFDKNNNYVSNISVTNAIGTQADYFKVPNGIVTQVQPPQAPKLSPSRFFAYISISKTLSIKVQPITHSVVDESDVYQLDRTYASADTSKAQSFIFDANKFSYPEDIIVAGDGTGYIFVVDSDKDSLYQFTSTGLEGVNPPPGSVSKKNIKVSFGGLGSSLYQFNNPMGVAYYNKTLYIADAGNQRIVRYKLTTDIR